MRDPVCGMPIDEKTEFVIDVRGRRYYFDSEYCMRVFQEGKKIAYFSMEIGLFSDVPTYSGGLGVLAGDTIRSAADLNVPMVAVTLVSKKGYFKQVITPDGKQMEYPDEWNPSKRMGILPQTVKVNIEGRSVAVKAWMYDYQSPTGGLVSILFLDTDVEGNNSDDREITSYLYGGDDTYRMKQELVLGIGGIRMLQAAGFKVSKYHMNEGHPSLLTMELLRQNDMNDDRVRDVCVFTTHTPIPAAFDKFNYDEVSRVIGQEVSSEALKEYGGHDQLNMTLLALNLSKYVNGVAKRHRDYSEELFPRHRIRAITNGVHSATWTCQSLRRVFDKYIPGWANEPELLTRADEIPNEDLWEAHEEAKRANIDFVNSLTKTSMDYDVLTIGFARRATAYKRQDLFFTDLDRLRQINKAGRIQAIFAGKAHPKDTSGKELIQEVYNHIKELKGEIKMVYLQDYNLDIAAKLVSGVDVWLNTPLPPFEASGTSGMKAAHNGVLNFSVLDGWWVEGNIEEVTGWAIGPAPEAQVSEIERRKNETKDLYNKLEYIILPMFYERRDEWIVMMKNSITKLAYYFNSHRMMLRYATEAYL
ncbi:alpha-glucan family phosphorylase [Candidatus Bathyarchaeota archaeon]|nr:alpha-glucan family phosphorylase [Candidatus Bathyarchaeota archaeon]